MKTKFIFIICVFFTNFCFTQINYQVKYKMTTLFDGLKNYDAKLTFSEQKSCFEYILFAKDTASIEQEDKNGNKVISISNKRKQLIFTNLKEKKIKELKHFKITYLVDDTLSIPQWDITNEIKTINNHKCQKATTFFKGRTYEVWYASEYPTIFGPWKLNGLPGLIILAMDKKKEIYFEATEIQKNDDSLCQEDSSIERISRIEFDNQMKNWQKDYEEQLKSFGDRNLKIEIKFGKAVDIEIID